MKTVARIVIIIIAAAPFVIVGLVCGIAATGFIGGLNALGALRDE